MEKPTDDANHIIGNQLGGTGRSHYNIFPQSPNINPGARSREENEIRNLILTKKQPIEVVVQLYHSTTTATRTERFTYRAAYNDAYHSTTIIIQTLFLFTYFVPIDSALVVYFLNTNKNILILIFCMLMCCLHNENNLALLL
ncbi:unnamed protein product [Adineta steineri]|uniref:Type VII secretion system protein EssD-like domain-containing protein n=1 Tax=Adineta steineri TaxID=433720 RepID=A0A814MG00_9BILA|nr:unnamed protein product [Adineta steineri]CAF3723599.1 unnamed protein product [Adineta steineri]